MADDQPTCGKGLAANAILPERLAALMNAMATMLENHTRALDPSETNGRLERDAYERLAGDQRALASGLEAFARSPATNVLPAGRGSMTANAVTIPTITTACLRALRIRPEAHSAANHLMDSLRIRRSYYRSRALVRPSLNEPAIPLSVPPFSASC